MHIRKGGNSLVCVTICIVPFLSTNNIKRFIEVIKSLSWATNRWTICESADAECLKLVQKIDIFSRAVQKEVQSLDVVNVDEQLQMAQAEIREFSCVSFTDHWCRSNSMLLGCGGSIEAINIRRAYTLGWCAISLRGLGLLVFYCREQGSLE